MIYKTQNNYKIFKQLKSYRNKKKNSKNKKKNYEKNNEY